MLKLIKRALNYNGSMVYNAVADSEIEADYQHQFIVKTFKKHIQNKKVLDAGCWTAPLAKAIIDAGVKTDYTGLDFNKDALTVAKKNFPKFTFIYQKLETNQKKFIEKYKNSFDTIFFFDVIEHVAPGTETDVLKVFYQLLKPNGVVILSTMSSHPLNAIDPAWFFGHRHYTTRQLLNIILEAGFKVSEFKHMGNVYWDFDVLCMYIYKHIFHRYYSTPHWLKEKIMAGLKDSRDLTTTRFYCVIQKYE